MTALARPLPLLFVVSVLSAVGLVACGARLESNGSDAGVGMTSDAAIAFGEGGIAPDAGARTWPATRFASKVVSFTAGKCAGYGKDGLPALVVGPPVGYGTLQGSTDVVSLGEGGQIVVSVEPNEIVDGEGPDFVVFENAFFAGGNPTKPHADLGEVSISEDGNTWYTYPCTATAYPYGACAGWHPVFSAPGNDVSPIDPKTSGGDLYDLAGTGMTKVRFIRIVDKSLAPCTEEVDNYGFDLDGIGVINGTINP